MNYLLLTCRDVPDRPVYTFCKYTALKSRLYKQMTIAAFFLTITSGIIP